jgi:glutathione synthase/RimK-type ligase-like ATP-grasp enzyme
MPAREPKIAVIARSLEDPCIALVARAARERGAELQLALTGPFPAGAPLALELDGRGLQRASLGAVRLDELDALWVRHLDASGFPEGMRADERAACETQAAAALWSITSCVTGLIVDPPEALLGSPQKPRLSQLAAAFGLDVPRSLVTNSPEAVREFAKACGGRLIGKMIESGALSLADPAGAPQMPTFALDEADLGDLAGLEVGPMLFQERLEKRLELRITVVGHQLFVAAVDPKGAVDVRLDPALVRGLRRYDGLPPEVAARLLSLCTWLGLNFATADVVLTPEGRYVLLEVNSVSFFDHVEEFAGLPISGAIADLLLGRAPPRVANRRLPVK